MKHVRSRNRIAHGEQLVVSSFIYFGKELLDSLVARKWKSFGVEIIFDKQRLETAPLVVKNSGQKMPESELGP